MPTSCESLGNARNATSSQEQIRIVVAEAQPKYRVDNTTLATDAREGLICQRANEVQAPDIYPLRWLEAWTPAEETLKGELALVASIAHSNGVRV